MNSIHVSLQKRRILGNSLRLFGLTLIFLFAGTISAKAQCPTPGLTITSTNSSCFDADDGTITITVDNPNGYAGNYDYRLIGIPPTGPFIIQTFVTTATSHTFTNLPPADYIFVGADVVDDNSCAALNGTGPTLTEPSAISLSAATLADCDLAGSGTIDLTVSGGTAPYVRFTWSGGLPDQEDHNGTVSTGFYSVEVEDSNGCINTLNGIFVPGPPDATINPVAAVCLNDVAFNLSAVTAGGTWSGSGITDAVNGTFDPATAGTGTHTITYSVSDGNGCVNIDTEDVTVNPLPDATINPVAPVCVDAASFNLSAATAGGTWSGTGITNGASGTFDPAVAGVGTHTITYMVTGGGCTGTDTEDIVVNALPDATITPEAPVCVDAASFNLTAASAGGTWSGTGIIDPVNGTFDPVTAGVGVHTITYNVTDVNGCSNLDTEDITVNALPDATITPVAPVCEDAAAFNMSAATAGGTWSGTGITDAVNGTFNPVVAGAGVHTITYQITDGNGCTAIDTEDITVNALPDATITPEAPVCVDAASFNLTAATAGGNWSGTGITDAVNGTFDPAAAGVGVHTITYQITDANGCTGIDTEDITVNPLPDATITPVAPVCVNAPAFNLTAATAGGTWSGTGITDAINGTFDPNIAGLGVHTITYNITDANGCSNVDTEDITVNPLPDATITAVAPVCVDGAAFNLSAATAGGTWSGTGITDAVNGTFDPAIAGTGTHTITYNITDGNGCNAIDTEDIVVNPLPDATITAVAPVCEGSVAFNLSAATAGGTWSGTGITDAVNGTFDPVTAGIGVHTITYTITDANGCTNVDTEDISVSALPDATITPVAPACIDAAPFNLSSATAGGTWSGTGITDAVNGTFDPTVAGLGTHTITYTVTDAGGCVNSDTEDVVVNPLPDATITSPGSVCVDAAAFNLVAATAGGTWSGTGIIDAVNGTFDPAIAGGGTHTITYTITDGNGCTNNDTEDIDVTPLPDAGIDAVANNCESDTAIDLFALLGGTPQAGGTWTDDDATGGLTAGTFNATVPGATGGNSYDFTYTVTNPGCAPASATVTINLIAEPNAGIGSNSTACASTNNLDLYTLLAGNDPGGNWNDDNLTLALSGPDNQFFDPSAAGPGTYQFTYIISNPTCGANGTTVTVDVVNSLNAGIALANNNACDNVTDFDLFTGITGNDAGGTWSDDDATGALTGNLFDASAVANGTYQFTYTVTSPGCTPDSEQISVTVSSAPTADAGTDQIICGDVATMAATLGANETGIWTVIAGSGIFADNTDPSSSVSGLSAGTNTFQWEVTSLTGCTDIAQVNVDASSLTVADAGPDQDICTANSTLSANAPGPSETGTWSVVSGAAVFSDINDPNTTILGIVPGTILRWTISDNNGICPDTQSDVNINTVGSLTTADAGGDQILCVDFTSMSANAVAAGETGTWSVISGSAIFADINDPTTAITGLSVGLNELQWEIAPNSGPCPPSTDIVNVEVAANTVAAAGPDQNICVPNATMAANNVGFNETGTWFVIAGTGVFADANDPNTTVTGLSAGINTFRWSIADNNGICSSSSDDVDVDLSGSMTLADAGADQTTCDTFTTLNANAVSGTETGTWTVVSGTGIFADANDPLSGVTGLSVGLNEFQWEISDNLGGCTPNGDIVAITAGGTTVADAGPDQNLCLPNSTLAGNPVGATETGTWSVISGTGVFADANNPSSAVSGMSIGLNEFRWTITDNTGTCGATISDVAINVLDPSDPLCTGGGGINCGAFVISVLEIRPSCINNDDGEISFNITGGSGNYTILLTDNNGFNKGETGTSAASIIFQDLTAADYEYTVDDGAGNTCTLPYSLVRQTTLDVSASNFVDVTCFGTSTGEASITINSGGNAPFEYSIDGLVWNTLAPDRVIRDLPPLGTYNVLLRDDAADTCPAEAEVTINNLFQDMVLTSSTTDATCNNAGGSIEVLSTTGGLAPYRYRLDGLDFPQLPAGNIFDDLSAGMHILTMIDDNNCEKDFNILVNAPGLVIFNASVVNPDCSGNGNNGIIRIQIDPFQLPGVYDVAISDDPNEIGDFVSVPANGIFDFQNMSVGNYWVTVMGQDGCPNTMPVNILTGPVALGFELEVECYNNRQALLLSEITAEDNAPFNIEVYRIGEITPLDVITLNDIPAGRIFRITDANFLNAAGSYQLLLRQFQSTCGANLESGTENFVINNPLNATLGEIVESFPERGTGSIWLENVNGGEEGYYALIEPGDGQWIEIPKNQTNQEFEYQFTDLFPGDYEIFIADEKGCEIMFAVTVPQDTDLFIPNVFTPNGDGYNDSFFIRNLPVDGTKLMISNRLGRKIYETDNYQNDWSGDENADGVYFYTLVIGDEKYSGWIEMWRGGINK